MIHIPYPSNYFDPYGDEPTHVECCTCFEWVNFSDAQPVNKYDRDTGWLCDSCLQKLFLCFTPGHDRTDAEIAFEERYGQPPDQIHQALGLLWLGPIPIKENQS